MTPDAVARYDYLLRTPLTELNRLYIFMLDTGDGKTPGDVIKWNELTGSEVEFLYRLDIIDIENERGTQGKLRQHFGLPFFYTSGGGAVAEDYTPVVVTVTPEVPAIIDNNGVVVPQSVDDQISEPPLPPPISETVTSNNILPIALTIGVASIAVFGDRIFKKRKKILFLGGVAALFYFMVKKQA